MGGAGGVPKSSSSQVQVYSQLYHDRLGAFLKDKVLGSYAQRWIQKSNVVFRNLLFKRALQEILMYSQVGETTALASLRFSFFSFSSLCYMVGKYCDVGLGWPFGARRVRGGHEGERQAHAILERPRKQQRA